MNDLYRNVMWLYRMKFSRENSSPSQGVQLMKLSELLQILLGCHPQGYIASTSPDLTRLSYIGSILIFILGLETKLLVEIYSPHQAHVLIYFAVIRTDGFLFISRNFRSNCETLSLENVTFD